MDDWFTGHCFELIDFRLDDFDDEVMTVPLGSYFVVAFLGVVVDFP